MPDPGRGSHSAAGEPAIRPERSFARGGPQDRDSRVAPPRFPRAPVLNLSGVHIGARPPRPTHPVRRAPTHAAVARTPGSGSCTPPAPPTDGMPERDLAPSINSTEVFHERDCHRFVTHVHRGLWTVVVVRHRRRADPPAVQPDALLDVPQPRARVFTATDLRPGPV